MIGYWNNASATAETLKDGWLHTGDLGVLDERGLLTFVDRMKDIIISGGPQLFQQPKSNARSAPILASRRSS